MFISIHAPLRERHIDIRKDCVDRHFNPRSLAGATRAANRVFSGILISIHAPLRERRWLCQWCFCPFRISIHAPLRERPTNPVMLVPSSVFQSTLPCGSDFFKSLGIFLFSDFNPRSLAGATSLLKKSCKCSRYFNPRSLAGATCRAFAVIGTMAFQSTLPCGSDC